MAFPVLRAAAARPFGPRRDASPILIPLLISTDSRAGEEGAIRSVDHAVVGGVVAVVVFAMLCLLIILGRYFARHKGKTKTETGEGEDTAHAFPLLAMLLCAVRAPVLLWKEGCLLKAL